VPRRFATRWQSKCRASHRELALIQYRSGASKTNGPTACLPNVRCPRLELYEAKVSCTVPRGGSAVTRSCCPANPVDIHPHIGNICFAALIDPEQLGGPARAGGAADTEPTRRQILALPSCEWYFPLRIRCTGHTPAC
jgi:hypothetical protein